MKGRDRERNTLLRTAVFALLAALGAMLAMLAMPAQAQGPDELCYRELEADIVAFDMPLMFNRMGAQNINGMMYALRADVVDKDTLIPIGSDGSPGGVTLRPDKRPRPLVLRMGQGDCMTIRLTNLLNPIPNPFEIAGGVEGETEPGVAATKNALTNCSNASPPQAGEERSTMKFTCEIDDQTAERSVGLHFQGVQLVPAEGAGILSDGSWVGKNPSSLAIPGQTVTYKIYAPQIGEFVGSNPGAQLGGEGLGGQTASGLFAALNVSGQGAVFYRSSVENEDMVLALDRSNDSGSDSNYDGYVDTTGHPIMNYDALYEDAYPWNAEGKAGRPVLNMYRDMDGDGAYDAVHTALDAIVAYGGKSNIYDQDGPGDDGNPWANDPGHFPRTTYPLEEAGHRNPTVPSRLEPFREFSVIFHDEIVTKQAFPGWFEDPIFSHTLHGVRDAFMINYGSGGIGSDIIANRLGVGPMHDCVNCAYEEFFLTFHAVGEVGQLTDIPANFGLENCTPQPGDPNCGAVGPKANKVLFPGDPSNVHHTYIGDQVAFRNLHAGPAEQHVFHLHNHQWLWNANDDNSNYLDAQGLGPGAGYGYWMNFSGSGNRNKTAGDAIFHCHFYPHFAQGMWEMWRIHDAFEPGTALAVTKDDPTHVVTHDAFNDMAGDSYGLGIGDGTPADGARALPDGEIVAGAPTPAVIPLMGKPIAPMPAKGVTVVANPATIDVCTLDGTATAERVSPLPSGACPGGLDRVAQPVGSLTEVDRYMATVDGELQNPGYPFWIAGMEDTVGSRPPTPPLDMMTPEQAADLSGTSDLWSHPGLSQGEFGDVNIIDGWDGGLPRFTLAGYSAGGETLSAQTRFDMSKEIEVAKPVFFPEEGTDLEQAAMAYHAMRCHPTYYPTGVPANCVTSAPDSPYAMDGYSDPAGTWYATINAGGFITNGQPPIPGAPFQEPCIDDTGTLLAAGVTGHFFDGRLTRLWDTRGMTTEGRSPHNAERPRYYKAANVQFDAVFNKQGYHFPQQRIITLWQDVVPTIKQERPPEPFVMRLNTFDCTQYVHSNVVPKQYELDDYQVRTPTDIIGQHIHLPKWDLVSADGSANGWNYEDGTLSPQMVVELIEAINAYNADPAHTPVLTDYAGNPVYTSEDHASAYKTSLAEDGMLHPSRHPYFGAVEAEYADRWDGARSTMQRWFADPVVNVEGVDRGLGIIFTHDHFGPSTHQQVGLYATVLIEPAGSKWVHNEEGVQLGINANGSPSIEGRLDGGPTSWQAAILTGDDSDGYGDNYYESVGAKLVDSHREFYFEYSDFQHAYQPGVFVGIGADGLPIHEYDPHVGITDLNLPSGLKDGEPVPGNQTFREALQPPHRLQASTATTDGFPVDIWEFPATCPGTEELGYDIQRPCAEAITADDPGMYVVNYRNESLAARIYDPNRDCPDGKTGCQAEGRAGDLAFAMSSNVARAIPALNDKFGLAPAGYFDGTCSMDPVTGAEIFCPPINNPAALQNRDPFTPMVRANDGDHVHIKMQAGGQEEEHTAIMQGLKWLQAGAGFGEAKNSGWRNAQAGGISEQFALRMPIFADNQQRGQDADSFYSFNASIDGWNNGSWGLIRQSKAAPNLFVLPSNDTSKQLNIVNSSDFSGVCPKDAYVRAYDITAVAANDVFAELPTSYVTIQDLFPNSHMGGSPDGGGTLIYNPRTTTVNGVAPAVEGGIRVDRTGPLHDPTALLYVNTADLVAVDMHGHEIIETKIEGKRGKGGFRWDAFGIGTGGSYGYIHAMSATDWAESDDRCYYMKTGGVPAYDPTRSDCPVVLRHGAPVEPVVIRANAGDCITVNLRNKVLNPAMYEDDYGVVHRVYRGTSVSSPAFFDAGAAAVYTYDANGDGTPETEIVDHAAIDWDQTLDLATGNAIVGAVRRDAGDAPTDPMTVFQSNMMAPSAWVGMQPALVEYDVTKGDGMNVGTNPANQSVAPGSNFTFKWYAGHLDLRAAAGPASKRNVELVATPIEFGGFNIMPADKIEQGQKGLFGAGAIYPYGSTWEVDAGRTTAATVYSTGASGTFRDFTTIAAKGLSMFYSDSYPVENQEGEGSFGVAEDSQDMGHMAINYGNEAMWFRYGYNPTAVGGAAGCADHGDCMGAIANAEQAYANALISADPDLGDPETAVFTVGAGDPFRMHVLMPSAVGRGSTFDLHGHVWQRDPYVCVGEDDLGVPGKCDMGNGHAGSAGNGNVGSRNLGWSRMGFYIGGIESWFAGQHYEVVIPRAGGDFSVGGDYLFRDHMGLGNTGGLWGIVRVADGN